MMVSDPAIKVQDDVARDTDGWQAGLSLAYYASGAKTVLLRQDRRGPLFVQKPFYPEGPGVCHTYILHPPGGVVGGDALELAVTLNTGSHAVITTPAAGKYYRSAGPRAVQINRLSVAAEAVLEWLPQETIIYNGADAVTRTTVKLEAGARFIGWELICLGLPACGQTFQDGRLAQHFEIRRGQRPLLIEPLRLTSADPVLNASWGMGGRPVVGILVATVDQPHVLQSLQACAATQPGDDLCAATQLGGLTVCRYLGHDVYAGHKFFHQAWQILRPIVTGRTACPPRIWAT